MATPKFSIIRDAIKAEEDAFELYSHMKERAKEPGPRKLLAELANEELRHKRILQDLGVQDLRMLSKKNERIGVHKLDVVAQLPKPLKSYELERLFIFALKKEGESVKRYKLLADLAEERDIKDFFLEMMEEEKKHIRMINEEVGNYRFRIRNNI